MMFGTKHVFQYLVCNDCASLTLQNIPENLGDYYPNDYYSFVEEKQNGFKNWVKFKVEEYSLGKNSFLGSLFSIFFGLDANFKAIEKCNPNKETTKILDVGCGGGILLHKLRKQGFTKLYGVDPYIANDIITKDIVIKKASLTDLLVDDEKYDVIMMSHVLEHMESPNQQLQEVQQLLNENGRLIIRVPISSSHAFEKFRNNWFQIDAPRHLFIPSLRGMNRLSVNQNLRVQDVFFDSMAIQFTASQNYAKGIPLKDQANLPLFKRFSPKRLYYSFVSRKLNKLQKGDQATFIFSK